MARKPRTAVHNVKVDPQIFEAAKAIYESLDLPPASNRDLCEHALIFYAAVLPAMVNLAATGRAAGSPLGMAELMVAAARTMENLLHLKAAGEQAVIVTERSLQAERDLHLTQILDHIGDLFDCSFAHTFEDGGRLRVEVITDGEESKTFSVASKGIADTQIITH